MFHKRSSAINLIYSGQQLFSYTAVIYNNELEQKSFMTLFTAATTEPQGHLEKLR
jgi:hypothetical protein